MLIINMPIDYKQTRTSKIPYLHASIGISAHWHIVSYSAFKEMSMLFTECVSAPIERKSTPDSAFSRMVA